ncbi:hypothetical protein ACFC09_36100 [Streptomyces sp. NPDC056161]|uniref:hypothetical protein n=1 Tax=Streptomyces sp. NPDC056161 TaxID=3345732 RepID=UPI0035DBC8DE
MPKTWGKDQARKFCRELKPDHTYYVIRETTHLSPLTDKYHAISITFPDRLPLTNNPCTEHGYSAEQFCQLFGPVYDAKPSSVRLVEDPGPQFAPMVGCVDSWIGF